MSRLGAPSNRDADVAATTLCEHLATLALGGNHPLMVVVPRDALEEVLAELDELTGIREAWSEWKAGQKRGR